MVMGPHALPYNAPKIPLLGGIRFKSIIIIILK